MKLDIENNVLLVLDEKDEIGPVVKSQLSFWNFEYDYSKGSYSAVLDKQLFLKLNKYIEDEGLKFKLSKKAKKYTNDLTVVNLAFENKKKVAKDFKDGLYNKIDFDNFRKFVLKNIQRTLKIHQLKAAYHLYLLGNGANFSVPGSGKTSVVLTVYEKLRSEGKVNKLFVVGPPSSFGPWRSEFVETLGRDPNALVVAGGNKVQRRSYYQTDERLDTELYLTSFQSLLSDQKELKSFLQNDLNKVFFIVDEAHYIKSVNGEWAQAVLKQAELAIFRCVLTGTPMPRSYSDIFNLFDFLWPNQHPISGHNKNVIKYNEEHGNSVVVKSILDEHIGPLFYRVRKVDLRLMPQNFIKPYTIGMNKYERKIYDAVYNKIKDYSKEEFYKNLEFVGALARGRIMRLRQATSYTKLLRTAIEDYSEDLMEDFTDLKTIISRYDTIETPAKITHLLKIIKRLQSDGQKVVVWSNFIETIKLIEKHLKQSSINCKKIIGNTPVESSSLQLEETREKIRDEFIDPNSGLDVLIANPAACAESISLHKTCHHAIYYDLTYNCAQYLQSLDRIHRVGGSETIEANYHFLQYRETIDLDIKKNIDQKANKMFGVIEQDYAIYSLSMNEPDGDAEAYQRLFLKRKRKSKNS